MESVIEIPTNDIRLLQQFKYVLALPAVQAPKTIFRSSAASENSYFNSAIFVRELHNSALKFFSQPFLNFSLPRKLLGKAEAPAVQNKLASSVFVCMYSLSLNPIVKSSLTPGGTGQTT